MTKKKIIKKNGQNRIVKKKTVKKSIPKAEPKNDIVLETLVEKIKQQIIPAVVSELKVDLDKAVNGKFEDIKNIINNEMKDVRGQLAVNSEIAQHNIPQPVNSSPLPQAEVENPIPNMTQEMIPQLLMSLLSGNNNNNQGGFNGIIMEGIQRKMLADMNRQDIQSQAISQAVVKKLLDGDSNLTGMMDSLNQTNEALMKPLHDYGKNMQKREEAKKE
tara:strand:- start:1351 stop:2001 length:651 start_codon:yes stop_codon:yes gene_type:complete